MHYKCTLKMNRLDRFRKTEEAKYPVPKQPETPEYVESEYFSKPEVKPTYCPFCWKKLGDNKLAGTTHIKACGKGLTFEQIDGAIRVQERHQRDWTALGLSYPPQKTARPPPKRRNTKRKAEKIDPETLPLFTTSASQKRATIVHSVSTLIKDSSPEREEFYIRDPLPPSVVSVPRRLRHLHDPECRLWRMAASAPDMYAKLEALPPIARDVGRMLVERVGCDMMLVGRDGNSSTCHRFVLEARCPEVLRRPVKEEHRNVIQLTGFSKETIESFLWFVYTGGILNEALLTDVRRLAVEHGLRLQHELSAITANREDDYLMELRSPEGAGSSQSYCMGSPTIPPLVVAPGSTYSATQVANMLQTHEDSFGKRTARQPDDDRSEGW